MIVESDQSILNLKIILYCFEWLLGLKINFHKSEVFVSSFEQADRERVANMLNCKLGKLPLNYLGIPISDQHLGVGVFEPLSLKMYKRLSP